MTEHIFTMQSWQEDVVSGTFVIKHDVGFDEHGVTGTWEVLSGSGTGELAGLSGHGTISGASETMNYTFDYELAGQ